jgi:lipoate-protein ligase A
MPMPVFEQLLVWMDPVKRPGPESMAVDDWILETMETPVLRVYGWLNKWGSIGYFADLATAKAALPELEWVRRRTGGGVVDHRTDWTYTVFAPADTGIARIRGAESYRIIHEALVGALRHEDIDAFLSRGADSSVAALCFDSPVGHDLIDAEGRKLAGAGQRRTRQGLLHQGSVAVPCDEDSSRGRSGRLADLLAEKWRFVDLHVPHGWISGRIHSHYSRPDRA